MKYQIKALRRGVQRHMATCAILRTKDNFISKGVFIHVQVLVL